MSSQIDAIYGAIARLGVIVNNTPIVGREPAQVSTIINTTPTRIISPLSENNEGRKATKATIGGSKMWEVDWTITDLLLFRRTSDGSGLEDDMKYLVQYQGAYVDVMRVNHKLGFARHVMITSIDVEIGVYRYPVGGDTVNYYHGAKSTVIVHEIIP